MPFKSKAQRRLFFAKEERGEIPKGTVRRWTKHTRNMEHLPEHVKKASAAIAEAFSKLASKLFSAE